MRISLSKLLLLAVFGGAVASFFAFDLHHGLTLESVQAQRHDLQQLRSSDPALALGGFLALYVVVTALSLPGAAVLSLAAGAIFGLFEGSVLVSIGSTAGASLAFLGSRFLFRDIVRRRFAERIKQLDDGFRENGASYLAVLRLVPVVPFFLVNLLMGLTGIRVATFALVSQISMLPATIVYVNAGRELGTLRSPGDILTPRILVAFILLGCFPFLVKRGLAMFRTQKLYSRFARPSKFDFDMVVIGAGSAGLVTAYIAAAVKAKVALIERHKMGGDCLNTGCVPSKALIRTGRVLNEIRRARSFGLRSAHADFDFAEVMERVQRVIATIEPHDSVERYSNLGVECVKGEAKILSPFEVQVGSRRLITRNIVIATGARPFVPPIPGLESVPYDTSDTIWSLRQKPDRLLVLGGGPIGCEMAQAFQRLGCQVTLLERGNRLMSREDEDVSALVAERLAADGVSLRFGTELKRFENEGGEPRAVCQADGQDIRLPFDRVFLALGRKANVEGFGLEDLGIGTTASGTIEVDECLRTRFPNILACGDVAGPYQFTHTASHQAWYAAVNGLFRPFRQFKVDNRVIPWCTYTDPEVARVGLSEAEAKERGIEVLVSRYGIDDLDRAICEEHAEGFVKVLTAPGTDRILGVTIVGAHAGDIVSEYVLAMKNGIGLNKILGTIHIYPTHAEANKFAAGVWKRQTAPQKLLRWVERFHAWRRAR